jgi:hypothetical protein
MLPKQHVRTAPPEVQAIVRRRRHQPRRPPLANFMAVNTAAAASSIFHKAPSLNYAFLDGVK